MVEEKQIPVGWSEYKLGNLFSERSKSKIQVSEASNHGSYPFFTSGEKVLIHDEYLIEGENLFLSTGGVANVKFYKGKCAYSTDTYAIYTNEETNAKYLYYFILEKLYYINNNYFLGSGLKHLQKKDFKQHDLIFPDIVEQQKIAQILTKVDEAITQTQKLIAKYQRIKTGLMQDLLTKGIDKEGNIRSEETHEFKDSPLGRIPVEWNCEPIDDLYDLKSGITPLRSIKKYFGFVGYNWAKTLDLNEGYLFKTEEQITEFALQNTSVKLMPKNSILIAMYGGWEQIGRTSILKEESATNQAVTCLYDEKREMDSDFVQLILQNFRFKWKQFAVSTRKDPNITKKDIEAFQIIFPDDITEQNEISKRISNLKENISVTQTELLKFQKLKSGLMQDLLSGKKRVTALLKNTSL